MYDWKWYLKDIVQDKDVSVFSCFSCGGGSTMGYKRAGFRVVGDCELDPKMNAIYVANHHPGYNYLMDLRDFNAMEDLSEELYHLDILDGSPPCSTFSTAGLREKVWGKEKVFKEGQKKQVLDDLFFVFLDTVEKLKPKAVIAENVTGILQGNAKGYVNLILKRFSELGYTVQMFRLNAAYMDVPQMRERVFFIANNQGYEKLKLSFSGQLIPFGQVRVEHGRPFKNPNCIYAQLLEKRRTSDSKIADIYMREKGKYSSFNNYILWDNKVANTIAANGNFFRGYDGLELSDKDYANVSSFPQDYDFGAEHPHYVCGMSVPPNMMANIATEIYAQWFKEK